MNQEIEVSGASVEEAVSAGLKKLRLKRNQVNIEILDEGRRAILGIGGRDAVVRLSPKPKEPKPTIEKTKTTDKPVEVTIEKPPAVKEDIELEIPSQSKETDETPVTESNTEAEAEMARDVIDQLLGLMEVNATIELQETETDELTGKKLPLVNINGDDLGVLIGSRGETLDSLQYISRLMVGHKLRQRATFVIDVEGYRQRREQALSRLAERMANKAVKRGSPVTLEAMPAYERRIIHMALRESDEVRTESTGEGNRRRVRIYPN